MDNDFYLSQQDMAKDEEPEVEEFEEEDLGEIDREYEKMLEKKNKDKSKDKNKLYIGQKKTTYALNKALNLSHDHLYQYARGVLKIQNMPSKILIGIANIEKINPNELYNKMIVYQIKRGNKNDIKR